MRMLPESITGRLLRESTPKVTKGQWCRALMFSWGCTRIWTVILLVIWDCLMLKWCHYKSTDCWKSKDIWIYVIISVWDIATVHRHLAQGEMSFHWWPNVNTSETFICYKILNWWPGIPTFGNRCLSAIGGGNQWSRFAGWVQLSAEAAWPPRSTASDTLCAQATMR